MLLAYSSFNHVFSYEVGVGSNRGKQDLQRFQNIGLKDTATLTNLALDPGMISD